MYDYIIIGAGSAGCVLANRLSAHPDNRVLVLEAGGEDSDPNIHAPSAWLATWQTEVDWEIMTVPQANASGQPTYIPRGKVLGGSSSINGMIYVRGHRADYDHWAFLGNYGWDYRQVLPYFKRSEDFAHGSSEFHGAGGELHVDTEFPRNPIAEAAVASAVEVGYRYNEDCNGAEQEGVGYTHLTVKDGKRHSTAVAFLRPAMHRRNLTVHTRARATRLLWEGTRCVGVAYTRNSEAIEARADRDVIVSAGAIFSPQLLMVSGIGDAQHLREHGIEPIVDLPGVGRNLQDHAIAPVIFEAKQPIPAPRANVLEAQLFCKSDARLPASDLQPVFLHIPYYPPGFEGPENAFTLCAGLVRPTSRGTIRLSSADPTEAPRVDPNYLDTRYDVEALIEAVRICRNIGHASAFDDWRRREVYPGTDDTGQLEDYVRRTCSTYHHVVGTCKMGVDADAVVDPELRVHGVTGLRVVDASICPQIPAGNTNAPTIMISEKAADLILGSAQLPPGT